MKVTLLILSVLFLQACAVNKILEGTGHTFACTSGDVTAHSAITWFRTDGKNKVSVQYGTTPDFKNSTTLDPVDTSEKSDFTAKITLEDLTPKTIYYFRGLISGKKPGNTCKFSTAPQAEDLVNFRFAFGGDTRESHQPFSIMNSIRAMKPDFFLFLGDTIYGDYEGGASSVGGYWGKYRTNRNDLASQKLFSDTSLYLIWDDHEVKNNYDPAKTSLVPAGRAAFFDYWPITQDPANPKRLYRSFRWGKSAELFILDTRQYRDAAEGTILGKEQKEWFLKALSSSNALFKFIATSVPISNRGSNDKWGGFEVDREEVLTYINYHEIPGVVFLAADVHYAADANIPDGEGLREFIVGPLATNMTTKDRSHYKKFNFYYKDSYNYGLVKVNAQSKSPYAEIEIRNTNNKIIYSTKVYPNDN
jgi:alkaline phosphatase D